MKHRMYHSTDLVERLDLYANKMNISLDKIKVIYKWMLDNELLFEEPSKEGVRVSICTIRVESTIEDPITRQFFELLGSDIPSTRVPMYGINWPTFKDRSLRVWEHIYNMVINKIPSHHIRIAWLRLGGAKIGKGSSIWRNTEVLGVENLRMGDDSTIAWHCQVDCRAGLVIGNHVAIASHVLIIAGSHDLTAPEFWSVSAPIYIDDYAWIASRALIAHGAHIGEGAVVSANTIVGKEVKPYKIVGGSGAKPMGERPRGLNYKVGGKGLFTFLH